jgi:hypothetical protein
MTAQDYHSHVRQINKEHSDKYQMIRKNYLSANAKFKEGDFIGCVLGIIKVETIQFVFNANEDPGIMYSGKKYRKLQGKLIPTKTNTKGHMFDYSNPKLIK